MRSSLASATLSSVVTLVLVGTACSSPSLDGDTSADGAELESLLTPGVDERLLDRSADPCKDFYAYACGGYRSTLPPGATSGSRFGDHAKERTRVDKQLVEHILRTPATEAERKAGAFMAKCLEPIDGRSRAYAAGFRQEIEAATTKSDILRLTGRLQRRVFDWASPFFSFDTRTSAGRRATVGVRPGGFEAWGADYSTDEGVAARVASVAAQLRTIEPSMTEDEALRIATATGSIERALSAADGAEVDPNGRPLGRQGLEILAPNLDWSAYWNSLGAPDDLGDFPVRKVAFFSTLDDVIQRASLDDLKAYLVARWYGSFAELVAPNGAPPPADRMALCSTWVLWELSDPLETRYLELAGVDEGARSKARALYRALITAFDTELREVEFLDAPTRAEAIVKLRSMTSAIGASKHTDDLRGYDVEPSHSFFESSARLVEHHFVRALVDHDAPLDLHHVDLPVGMVNAAHNWQQNKVIVPGGILGGLFFSPAAPELANFAAIGSVIGHEITHGFDSGGREYDANGMFRNWWSAASLAEFERRSACLVDQYNAFAIPELPLPGGGFTHVNGEKTLAENIADAGGLKLAYLASKVAERSGVGSSGFTPAQQFFVGFGQMWCQVRTPQTAAMLHAFDGHSPGPARVNGTLANFAPFAEAFQCATGTAMAPVNRCQVW